MNTVFSQQEYLSAGHLACPGCGERLALRYTLKSLGKRTILVIPAGCSAVVDGIFPHSAVKVPLLHTAFETTASAAAGVKAGLDIQGDIETTVVAWGGDGATFDIGFQALSGIAERNENLIYICYDNEAYMNTGIQRSSATPWGAWTTTTPVSSPKERPKKNITEIMAAHRIPYVATASIGFPEDYHRKLQKTKNIYGLKFVQILCPCPTGWRTPSDSTIRLARLAVDSCVFPLYEIENGNKYTVNHIPSSIKPVHEYIKLQGRFAHLQPEDIDRIQKDVTHQWETLLKEVKP